MRYKVFIVIFSILFLFSGCATKKSYSTSLINIKTQVKSQENGHIIFSDYDVPQPVNRIYYTVGGTIIGDKVSIFDITDYLTYVAEINVEPRTKYQSYVNNFAEADLPIGKRTLMLINHGIGGMGSTGQTDFIEVNVVNDHITHVAISNYPYPHNQHEPFKKDESYITVLKFTQLVGISDEMYNYCSQNICKKCKDDQQKLSNFLKNGELKNNNPFFNAYSLMLSDEYKSIYMLNQESFAEFEKYKNKIVEAKERDFSKWQTSNNKNKIFFIQPNT